MLIVERSRYRGRKTIQIRVSSCNCSISGTYKQLTPDQLEDYFSQFLDTHSWSTVKVERNGLQFFWRHMLKIDWKWINMVKPPQIKTIPDILSPDEIEQLIASTRKLRYRVFFLTTYSMGLRLSEALSLQVREYRCRS